MLENHGASRQRVYAELRQFLDIVGGEDAADEYSRLMSSLPDQLCQDLECVFRDYPAVFSDAKGLRMRVLRIVHAAHEMR